MSSETYLGIWIDNLINKRTEFFLKSAMRLKVHKVYHCESLAIGRNRITTYLLVVRTVETLIQPRRLCIGYCTKRTKCARLDLLFLVGDDANLKALVLRPQENFVSMKSKEGFSRVLSGYI